MKKTILLLASVVLLFSCNKPDEQEQTTPTTSNSVIVKKWKLYKKYNNGTESTNGDMEYWDFKSDYKLIRDFIYADTTILPNATYTDTWSLANNDSELRIKLDRWIPTNNGTDSIHMQGYEIHSVLKLSADTLILEEDLSDEDYTMIVKRILIPN